MPLNMSGRSFALPLTIVGKQFITILAGTKNNRLTMIAFF